jgi:sugar O-acyltransferase (sialic acid O-acetyltransferase NeuD family)
MTRYITAPMVNVNDESATLSVWLKEDKSLVHKGEVIAVLETAKATVDLEAEGTGYLHLFVAQGEQVGIGDIVAALCDTANEVPARPATGEPIVADKLERKVTKKAELVATKAGLDLKKIQEEIQGTGTIAEADVEAYLRQRREAYPTASAKDTVDDIYPQNRQQRLLIVGGGLGAVQLLDSLTRIEHQRATAIVDDNTALHGKSVMGVPVLGGQEAIKSIYEDGLFDAAVISVSTSIPFRENMTKKLGDLAISMANVIDPTARVQRNAILGTGNVILAYCHIGSCAILGHGNFLSPFVDVEHHCTIANFCTFGPGVMMSSLVKIGARVKFGTGIFIEPKISIGADTIVGSGAILTRDIPQNSIVKTKVSYTIRSRT